MSLLFTKVTVTDSEDGAEFLVRGIPRSIEDLRGYTAFEEFLDGICLDDDITVYCAPSSPKGMTCRLSTVCRCSK